MDGWMDEWMRLYRTTRIPRTVADLPETVLTTSPGNHLHQLLIVNAERRSVSLLAILNF